MATDARAILLDTFAHDESASVQATLYKMAERIIAKHEAHVAEVSISLPNKHYIPIDLSWAGLNNTKPADAEVFLPSPAPRSVVSSPPPPGVAHCSRRGFGGFHLVSGLITATIARKSAA
jgi:urate oxidase